MLTPRTGLFALLVVVICSACEDKTRKPADPAPVQVAPAVAAPVPEAPKPSAEAMKTTTRALITTTVSQIDTAQFDFKDMLKKLPKSAQPRAQSALDTLDAKKLAVVGFLVALDNETDAAAVAALTGKVASATEEATQALNEATTAFAAK